MSAAAEHPVRAPIIVVGTHRSGTSFLGRAIGRHSQVAYWEEPREVWSYTHHGRPDDSLAATDLSPRAAAYVRQRFADFLASAGRARLAEKTPSNCLRLEYVHAVFPDALFVHIVRDGRAVVHSTRVMTREARIPIVFPQYGERLRGTPLRDWPALARRAWRGVGRRFFGLEMEFWGPRPPGWRDWLRDDPRLTLLAKQWRYTLEPALSFSETVPPQQWLELRYEDLVRRPIEHARRIEEFAGLPADAEYRRLLAEECRTDRIEAWRRNLSDIELDELRPVVAPVLERLGYAW